MAKITNGKLAITMETPLRVTEGGKFNCIQNNNIFYDK